jgi:hypothetical protein
MATSHVDELELLCYTPYRLTFTPRKEMTHA